MLVLKEIFKHININLNIVTIHGLRMILDLLSFEINSIIFGKLWQLQQLRRLSFIPISSRGSTHHNYMKCYLFFTSFHSKPNCFRDIQIKHPGPTRGGFRGYIVPWPGPRGPRKSSGVRVKFWCRTQWRMYGTKFQCLFLVTTFFLVFT